MSPLLHVLVSEVLAANIRCNSRISALLIPGFPPLSPILQYADDTSLIVSSDDAIKAIFETYALFEREHTTTPAPQSLAGGLVWSF